jgi:amino acid adenylation domain-containing protein
VTMEEQVVLQGPIENALVGLCSTALNNYHVTADTNILASGYSAELAAGLQRDIEGVFQITLPENCLQNYPTPRLLARVVIEASAQEKGGLPPLTRRPRNQPLPLSFSQERMWFVHQLNNESTAYNVGGAIGILGPLDREILQKSLDTVRCRHEILRTVFPRVDGHPVQKILPFESFPVCWIDLRGFPLAARREKALNLANECIRSTFNLEECSLYHFWVIEIEPEDHLVVHNFHHIIMDAWALTIFFRDLVTIYEAYRSGEVVRMTELPFQYADYVVWQRKVLDERRLAKQMDYWLEKLNDLSPLELPMTFPRPAVQSYRGSVLNVAVPESLLKKLCQYCEEKGATLFMAFLAAFYILLYRYTGQSDLSVAVPIANRNFTAAESIIGTLVNTLILRVSLPGQLTFGELLRRVRQTALQAYDHQDLPFSKIITALQPERSTSRSPLVQVMFNMVNMPFTAPKIVGMDTYEVEVDRLGVQFDLAMHIYEKQEHKQISLEYNTDLFDRPAIERMLTHYLCLMESALSRPDQPISRLELLTPAEWQQLEKWNDTVVPFPADETIPHLFDQQAQHTPLKPALLFGESFLTYEVLNERANQLAHYLQQLGIEPGTVVGLCVKRSVTAVVAILGILKAGAAYLPLDPSYPVERLAYMLKDSGAPVLVGLSDDVDLLKQSCKRIIRLDTEADAIAAQESSNLPDLLTPDSPLYILYTSGSTGQPKGVIGTHRTALNRFFWMWRVFPFKPGEITCQKTALSFVDSIWELFGALLQGVPTAMIPDETLKDPADLVEELARQSVSRIVLVPSLLRTLLDTQANLPQKLARVWFWISSGETLPVNLVKRFAHVLPAGRLINLYGSSEVAGDVTWYDTRNLAENASTVPIGHPIDNTTIYVLDADMNPLPVGILGEIYVGGANLATSYHNAAELTAQKFVADPFQRPGARLYRTGDLGCFLPDGNVTFSERCDYQVKIRGMRIALNEVESLLSQYPGIQECKVLIIEQNGNGESLVAYYVAYPGIAVSLEDLRMHLRHRLPQYMVPDRFICLPQLPRSSNGKLDRKALSLQNAIVHIPERKMTSVSDPLEQQISHIWEEVLEIQPISRNDNFFDLGGHSLLAMKLLALVEETLGVRIPVIQFFQSPTVAGIAQTIRMGGNDISWPNLVPIHPQGMLPPFFCVHGHGGGVTDFSVLSRLLGTDQPFFGLQAPGLDGRSHPVESIEEIASIYIHNIQSEIQPRGPYYLGGYCFGGLVAYEMACQLAEQGEKVALVALINTYAEKRFSNPKRFLNPLAILAFLRNLPLWLMYNRKGLGWLLYERTANWLKTFKITLGSIPNNQTEEIIDTTNMIYPGFSSVTAAHLRAFLAYQPRFYPGRVDVFRLRALRLLLPFDRDLGWGRYVAEVGIHIIPGAHYNLLEPPHVEGLASALKSTLALACDIRAESNRSLCRGPQLR